MRARSPSPALIGIRDELGDLFTDGFTPLGAVSEGPDSCGTCPPSKSCGGS
jgi:hypothetical protein